jgi:Holliday junction resolvase RusA-like endonuclease
LLDKYNILCYTIFRDTRKEVTWIFSFTVYGEPMGKQRPRFGRGRTYTPKKTVDYEKAVKEAFNEMYEGQQLNGAIRMYVNAFFSIPKSTPKKKRQLMIDGIIRPTKKPDIDNIWKIIADSLNENAYPDDSSVVSAKCEKFYGEIPRVEVEIEEIL